jgi:hypothetical protein
MDLKEVINSNNLCLDTYWMILDSPVFYAKLVKIPITEIKAQAVINVTMVEKPCTFCIRAVLEWGSENENPADLDFHVLNVAQNEVGGWKPEGCQDDNEVYWDDQRGPKWGGVSLDVDATAGYGPETVTFAAGVENGQYNLVVNVYTKGVEEADGTFANDPNHRMVVRIYDGTGLIAVALPSSAVRAAGAGSAWWVGTVTKAASGYTYRNIGAVVKKTDRCSADTVCSSLSVVDGTIMLYLRHSLVLNGQYTADNHVQDMNNLGYSSLLLYYGGSCSCWNQTLDSQGPGVCLCNGQLQNKRPVHVSSGIVNVNLDSFQSLIRLSLFHEDVFCTGTYWLYLDSPVFYGKLLKVPFFTDESQVVVYGTMVEKA